MRERESKVSIPLKAEIDLLFVWGVKRQVYNLFQEPVEQIIEFSSYVEMSIVETEEVQWWFARF